MTKKILIITDKYYKEMGGSYEAIGSTVYNLKKDDFNIKFVYFHNGETEFNLDLVKIINKVDIVHFFGIWTINHIKTAILKTRTMISFSLKSTLVFRLSTLYLK